MKRIFALTLAALLVLSLAACGSTTITPTAGDIEDLEPSGTTEATEFVFSEVSVHESDMCSITITGVDAESPSGYVLELTIANNTEAEEISNIEYVYEMNDEGEYEVVDEIENIETNPINLVFTLTSAKINGTQVEANYSSDAESGMRNRDQIVFDAALVDTLGEFTEIELSFRVYDSSNADVDVAVATATIYPNGQPAAE